MTSRTDALARQAQDGAAIYTHSMLRMYDRLVFSVNCPLVWGVSVTAVQRLYDAHATPRHLDVGVGTGYFLDETAAPLDEITLVDLNRNSLRYTESRLNRYRVDALQADVTDPAVGLPLSGKYTSASANFLLHCLPGGPWDKARTLQRIAHHLAPGAKLFGATVLTGGSPQARAELALLNRLGVFHNRDDDWDSVQTALKGTFAKVTLSRQGSAALFVIDC